MAKIGSMRFTNTNKDVKYLLSLVSNGGISFAIPIQRGYVWDKAKKSEFILNMIEGGPTFPIYASTTNNIDYIIDGQQRLRTTGDFVRGVFALSDLPDVEMSDGNKVDISRMKFEKLPQEMQNEILKYTFDYNCGTNLTEEQVRLVFIRLNSGKPLSATEMTRASINQLPQIEKMARHSVFKRIINQKGFETSLNDDIIMQIYTLLFIEKVDLMAGKIRKELMKKIITQDEEETITTCLSVFENIFLNLERDESYGAKRAKIFLTKKTHMISIIYAINESQKQGYSEKLLTEYVKFFFDGKIDQTSISADYNALLIGGTNKRAAVDKRAQIVYDSFLNYVENNRKEV